MQSLEVISINLWQIVISLINLVILFLIIKKFLFKPVKKVLESRKSAIDEQYASAEQAENQAVSNKQAWEKKIKDADDEADAIIKNASETAAIRGEKIVEEAKNKADAILRQAETDAELERRKADDDIKREIVDVSTILTEKMLGREINAEDHRAMIDSFIDEIGDDDDGDK